MTNKTNKFDPRPHALFIPSAPEAGKLISPTARYFECGCCGTFHAAEFVGDCRDNNARLDFSDIEAAHGDNWQEVDA